MVIVAVAVKVPVIVNVGLDVPVNVGVKVKVGVHVGVVVSVGLTVGVHVGVYVCVMVKVGVITVTTCEYPGSTVQEYKFTKLKYGSVESLDIALNVITSKFGTLVLLHGVEYVTDILPVKATVPPMALVMLDTELTPEGINITRFVIGPPVASTK